jgi:hypothetical protein
VDLHHVDGLGRLSHETDPFTGSGQASLRVNRAGVLQGMIRQGGDTSARQAIPRVSRTRTKNEGVTTESNPELKPQVSGRFRPGAQFTKSSRVTLSRWRHGFKSRWDYGAKHAGHGPSSAPASATNRRLQFRLIP